MRKSWFSAGILAVLLLAVVHQRLYGTMAFQSSKESRDRAAQLLKDGNSAEALPLYRALIEDPQNIGQASGDLSNAITCLQQLNRLSEFDQLIELAVDTHANDRHVLTTAAQWLG